MELTENYKRKLLSHVTTDNPKLFSMLYDINLLPECCTDSYEEYFMYGMIAMYMNLQHNERFNLLETVIDDLISYVQKNDDAPMSASAHLNHAIYTIFSTLPSERLDLERLRKEGCSVLTYAVTSHWLLSGCELDVDEKLKPFIDDENFLWDSY